ncbi:CD80-like immunoglobulin C2-set [Trinorchestia longiramus]|nr:CD80-like immunoglobulin C2-set [Trinorchestia longiramus]
MTFKDGSPVDNGTSIGPFDEGQTVELKCESGGGKPVPRVTWWKGTEELNGEYRSIADSNGTGTGTNALTLELGRADLMYPDIHCRVENEAMDEPAKLSLRVNVNGEHN